MSADKTFSNPLYRLYTQYVGEPRDKTDVYGFWLLLLGYLLAFVGILILLFGPIGETTIGPFFVREIAYVFAALGLAFGLLGIVFMLPVRTIGVVGALIGVVLSVIAVGWFTVLYPYNWALTPSGQMWTDIAIYSVGIAMVAGVAALVPVITGERSAMLETPEPVPEEGQASVMLGETDREGVYTLFQTGTANWEWRFIDEEAIADGGAVFSSRIETVDAVERTRDLIDSAGLLEMKHPTFRLYEHDEAEWQWQLVDTEGVLAARGDQTFASREEAEGAVTAFMEHGPSADTLSIEGAAFDYFREGDRWRWRLLDADRSELLEGTRPYETVEDAQELTDRIAGLVPDANVVDLESYAVELDDEDDIWRWRLLHDEEPIATSDREFESRADVEDAAHHILDHLDTVSVRDTSEPGFEVMQSATGSWDWRLQATSSAAIAKSYESVSTGQTAADGAAEFKEHAPDASTFVVDGTAFEIYSADETWTWRLIDEDRTVLAEAPKDYPDREAAEADLEEIRAQAPEADLIEFDETAFQIYAAAEEDWRWRLIDETGTVLSDSGEDYFSRDEAADATTTVKKHAPDAELIQIETAAFELYQDDSGDWFWRLIDETGDLMARSGQGHPTRTGAKDSLERLVDGVATASTREMTQPGFQIHTTQSDDWAWRFVTVDNRIIADGTETYPTRDQADEEVENIGESAAIADITVVDELLVDLLQHEDEWFWRILDADRTRLASSVRRYEDRDEATEAVESVIANAEETVVFDIDEAAFKLNREDGQVTLALIDEDHEVLGEGPHRYDTLDDARNSIQRTRVSAPGAESIQFEEAAFEVYQGSEGWRWRLIDERHRVLAAAADPFETREAAESDLEMVLDLVRDASILDIDTSAFEIHVEDGAWGWQLIDEHGRTLGRSLHTYSSRDGAREAMLSFKELGSEARISVAGYE